MALQKAGIEATVHEAHPAPAGDVGAWLGVQVNGLDALRVIEADQPVRDLGFATPVIQFRSGTGRRLGDLPTGRDGTVGVSVQRSELYRALHAEALGRGIEVRYGSRLADARTTPDGVTATFADGSTDSADLLVGADGVRSSVRSLLDPSAPPPRFVPVLNTAGYSEHTPADAEVGRLTMVMGRRAFFGWLPAPDGRTWWFANPPVSREPAVDAVATTSDAEWRSMLRDLLGADRSPAVALVDATPHELRGWTTYDVPFVRRWHDARRTVLIGDAAHATSPAAGQGSSLAMEDAVVLARCLRDLPVPEALSAYERARRGRTQRVVAQGFRTSSAKSPPVLGRVVRDLVMPLVLRHTDPRAWVRDHHIEWDVRADTGRTPA
jgi:2-polyprenyl-6-methoxyphenol hydroxylase-like FAD-dependent oxidoreductase